MEVDNTIGAKVGDHVMVSMEHMNILKATLMVYVIPMILLIAGIGCMYYGLEAAGYAGNSEVIAAVFGVALMGISYIFLKLNDKKFKDSKEFIPVITRILVDL